MTYKEFINNILQSRGRFMDDSSGYHERHHIVPRCKNGTDDQNNLIDLFAKEHFIAHKLLAMENSDDDDLVYAYILMAFVKDKNQQRYKLTPDEYEDVRKMHFQKFSGGNNPSAKQVVRLCDEKVYDTVRSCCSDNNIHISTMQNMLKENRRFMYYANWVSMSECERHAVKMIDWDAVQHKNRSEAAKRAGNGGSARCSMKTRSKISVANKGKHGTKVYCIELDETFNTIQEAADKYNINSTSIGYCLCGKQKHAGKHPITGEKLSWVKLENKNS